MNIFSNIGITELMLILLLALLVVGPERLPEVARSLAKTLRDVRNAYDNLTRDIGPELMSIQESTREIRESVESVRSIPKDTLNSVIKAADLDDTVAELRDTEDRIRQVGKTMSDAQKMVRQPLQTTAEMARVALTGKEGGAERKEPVQAASDDVDARPEAAPDGPAVKVDLSLREAAAQVARVVAGTAASPTQESTGGAEEGGEVEQTDQETGDE